MKCVGQPSAEFDYLLKLVGDGSNQLSDFHINASNYKTRQLCMSPPGGYDDVEDTFLADPFTAVTPALCRLDSNGAFNSAKSGKGVDVAAPMEYTVVEQILYSRVIPVVCLIGIVGNCLNLLALTSMILAHRTPMDRMERSATAGLLALAVSDLFFCVAVMPLAFVEQVDGKVVPPPDHLTLGLIYQVYTCLNDCMRYFSICYNYAIRLAVDPSFVTFVQHKSPPVAF